MAAQNWIATSQAMRRSALCLLLYIGMVNHITSSYRWLLAAVAAAATFPSVQAGTPGVAAKNPAPPPAAVDWKASTIAPVANPIFFEDPVIRSEIRPIFAYHRIDDGFITGGGEAYLYALQLRYAITDRLAFIATQDGFF